MVRDYSRIPATMAHQSTEYVTAENSKELISTVINKSFMICCAPPYPIHGIGLLIINIHDVRPAPPLD